MNPVLLRVLEAVSQPALPALLAPCLHEPCKLPQKAFLGGTLPGQQNEIEYCLLKQSYISSQIHTAHQPQGLSFSSSWLAIPDPKPAILQVFYSWD